MLIIPRKYFANALLCLSRWRHMDCKMSYFTGYPIACSYVYPWQLNTNRILLAFSLRILLHTKDQLCEKYITS